MEVFALTNPKNPKTGDRVKKTGVYKDEWKEVRMLKSGDTFPKDPSMGETSWKLAHYPFANQVTSELVPEEYRNEKDHLIDEEKETENNDV